MNHSNFHYFKVDHFFHHLLLTIALLLYWVVMKCFMYLTCMSISQKRVANHQIDGYIN